MEKKSYYDILGIKKNASDSDIKKAFRRLVRKFHPDVSNDPNADQKIAEINNAYETLSDKNKRAQYDAIQSNPFKGFGGFGSNNSSNNQKFRWEDLKESSPFNSGSFRFDDIFSAFGYKGEKDQKNKPFTDFSDTDQDLDQHTEITVDLSSVYTGDSYNIKLNVPTRMPNGKIYHEQKSLNVKIPKGITEDKQIRLTGQGAASFSGERNGDLFLKIKIDTPKDVKLDGIDVYQTVDIMPWEAALGTKLIVDTPAGSFDVNIPPNCVSGSNLRLKEKGIPSPKKHGNLYLILNIINPKVSKLTDAQKQAFENLKSSFHNISINR